MRPETVLTALMEQGPGDALQESVEDAGPLIVAIEYAAVCMNAEDTYVLNAINSEDCGFEELGTRLGVSRTHAWRLHQRALKRLRTLLLNQPEVRERMNMEPTWNAAAMEALVGIASFEDDWPEGNPDYPLADAVSDVTAEIEAAIRNLQNGYEMDAVRTPTNAAEYAVAYLRCVGQWSLLNQHQLLCSKQNDYGHGNILKFGMTGVMVRASDKSERLKNLTIGRDIAPRNESLLDTFFDVIGYTVIAVMLKAETFELPLDREALIV